MADLIAQGSAPQERWRRKLPPGVRIALGRQAGAWSTPWDDRISRRHVVMYADGGKLRVEVLEAARNPVFYRGHKSDRFSVEPGEHFVIGQTTFTFAEEQAQASLDVPQPDGERTFSVEDLRRQPFREADKRIEILSRLPEAIGGAASDQELFERLVNLLLSGIARATAAAVVKSQIPNPTPEICNLKSEIEILHWDRRIIAAAEFRPSQRLIHQAVESGESVAHVWSAAKEGPFTLSEGVDWAFCTPVPGQACGGWALYVTGSFVGDFGGSNLADAEALRDELKFTELAAATLSTLRESRLLAARQASLSQFFSPVVLEALAAQNELTSGHADDALAPREADVTVLFCDLRGFTARSEQAAGDLFGLLHRVSQALGVMTRQILDQGGVVGDFHGDAAMGFWGWPLPQPDAVERACRAALAIRTAFESAEGISDFRVGIGIASGRAVAGKIGTVDQVKVTVFGPVVNLASRLETMTRQLRASILIDPPTAAVVRATVPSDVCRVRRLALVRPVGLAAPIEVNELLPPAAEDETLSDEHLHFYEAALAAFQARNWPLALKHLHAVPPDDQAKDFLTLFITQNARTPPPNWDGSIPLEAK